jgi:hypothetical protein
MCFGSGLPITARLPPALTEKTATAACVNIMTMLRCLRLEQY